MTRYLPLGILVGLILVVVSLLVLYPNNSYWFPVGLTGFGFIFVGVGSLVVDILREGGIRDSKCVR